ncbi:hypothetical protein FAM15381_000685 [Propionibacterium freudenreichii]|uniref:hypothetical protein n=1 Tax=Propionibacterium freudenreichii TaxID=1744 RepID=UPI00254A8CBA|nr:hypothetical protein [Propionibacterium freudenreichii]MCT2990147.1 hypothetical protein [Propionibacterium freudenreichii]MCT2994251.1 hypothetical protein [Propionibacterium freudenreichii]MDK9650438.1 hypothetical protein [Propionibacterium freudenreichii]
MTGDDAGMEGSFRSIPAFSARTGRFRQRHGFDIVYASFIDDRIVGSGSPGAGQAPPRNGDLHDERRSPRLPPALLKSAEDHDASLPGGLIIDPFTNPDRLQPGDCSR